MTDFKPKQILERVFGFSEFRPGQKAVMSALWKQKAALAVFPTGGGKSLCYQLPALAFDGLTVVVSPLIALMKDQIDYLRSRGVAAARLDSSLPLQEQRAVNDAIADGTLRLLYVAPERFNNERFLGTMRRAKIALFAVDEAHCISEWGHNFRPDYLKLAETARELGVERVLALTATATPSVVQDICTAFAIPDDCAIVTGFYRENLNMCLTPVREEDRDNMLLKRLQTRKPGPTIVYVTLQKTAERVATLLEQSGLEARPYHAGMESEERSTVQDWWTASDHAIVVATIAFGMGIDKSNVRYVYHYNLPKGLESYCQEIGRAGRDGKKSTVELLACVDDVPILENFAYGDTPTNEAVQRLVIELLGLGTDFAVSQYALSNRYDLRPLVLKTILTYLELLGVLRQGTPFYAEYSVRPKGSVEEILAQFKGEPARLLSDLFTNARIVKSKYGVRYSLNPDEMAEKLGFERKRIVRAVEVLEERGLIELALAEVRQRYSRLRESEDAESLATELMQRFAKREKQEIGRIQQVLDLVTHAGCQSNALVSYFGEQRPEACGHCSYCAGGKTVVLVQAAKKEALPGRLDTAAFQTLRQENPEALGEARQAARFLCGLSSPATTRARISRNALFGAMESYPFPSVLDWCRATIKDEVQRQGNGI